MAAAFGMEVEEEQYGYWIFRQNQSFSLILLTATSDLKMRYCSLATEEEAVVAANTGIFSMMPSNMADVDYLGLNLNLGLGGKGRAYDYCLENLRNMGFPVNGLAFDPELVIRGLVINKEKGNFVKADRFGTRLLSTQKVSEIYGRELVDLQKESRWEFLSRLFSVYEAVAFVQMVDDGTIAAGLDPLDYKRLYKAVGKALFRAHVEGQQKLFITLYTFWFCFPVSHKYHLIKGYTYRVRSCPNLNSL